MNSDMHRPPGLVVVIVVTGVLAAIGLFFCGLGLVFAGAADLSAAETLLALACFALGVAEAVVCYGLWKGEAWGLGLAQAVYAIDILVGVASYVWIDSDGEAIVNTATLGAYVWMAVYVTRLKGMAPLSVHAPYEHDPRRNRPPL